MLKVNNYQRQEIFVKKASQNGFSIIEALLVLVVVGILGFTGWFIYHSQKVATKNYAAASTQTIATVNPYAGWKQYCDGQDKLCFKYPSNWTESDGADPVSTSTGTVYFVGASLESPDHSSSMKYRFPDDRDAGLVDFLPMSIDKVPGLPFLDVVGGIYTGVSNGSDYAVVNASAVSQYRLSVGHASKFINTARFDLPDKTDAGEYLFSAYDEQSGGSTGYTLTAAKDWFSTQSAKTSLLIMKSLSMESK